MSAQSSKDDSKNTSRTLENQKINRRRLENLPPEAPKWCQNGSKMAPRRPPGAEAGFGGLCGPLRGGPGRLLGPSGVALGASWGRRGPPKVSPEAPRGSPGGSRRASGTSLWNHFCCKACRHEKSKKNKHFSRYVRCCFYVVSCSSSSPSPLRRRKRAP